MREMGDFGSSGQLRAVVVGSSSDEFVRYAMDLLGEYEIEFVHCDDVYGAVGWLAKSSYGGNILAVGRLEKLAAEEGRFLERIGEDGLTCCCLANTNSGYKRKVSTAKQAGAFVIKDPAKIGEIVTKLLADRTQVPEKKQGNKAKDFDKNEFLVTKAEQDALLGTASPSCDLR